jgi:hypothetical protein
LKAENPGPRGDNVAGDRPRRIMTNASTPTSSVRNSEILEPGFLEELEGLPTAEIRRRRDLAHAEREFQSYLRRIVQVRLDILQAERERRRSGAAPGHIVDRLTKVLAEGPPRTSRGEALRFSLSAEEMEDADRRVEEILGSMAEVPAENISDEQLEETLGVLRAEERSVSSSRLTIFRVHDVLQDELKRRYREDPSIVTQPRS